MYTTTKSSEDLIEIIKKRSDPIPIESKIVTVDSIGQDNVLNNPVAYSAVKLKITETELIRYLLNENQKLTNQLITKKLSAAEFPPFLE